MVTRPHASIVPGNRVGHGNLFAGALYQRSDPALCLLKDLVDCGVHIRLLMRCRFCSSWSSQILNADTEHFGKTLKVVRRRLGATAFPMRYGSWSDAADLVGDILQRHRTGRTEPSNAFGEGFGAHRPLPKRVLSSFYYKNNGPASRTPRSRARNCAGSSPRMATSVAIAVLDPGRERP